MVKHFSLSLFLLAPAFLLGRATPVIDAVLANNMKDLAIFIEKKYDISERDTYDNTPLTHAAFKGNQQAADLLLQAGAKLSESNKDGDTALHLAAQKGHANLVTFLLAKGANAKAKNKKGETAFNVAVENKQTEVGLILAPNTNKPAEDFSKFASIKHWIRDHSHTAIAIGGIHLAWIAYFAIPAIRAHRAKKSPISPAS